MVDRLLTHHNGVAPRPRRGESAISDHGRVVVVAERVLPFMDTIWLLLDRQRRKGARILFEGAQGTLLDIDHGTYPS